ncbi:MAG: Helix-turn-helix domain [Acidimicrobiaceae bacterium]|nr:Helix-turn-helix domain [Acidimicrobiaceae bacterium]
MPVRPAPSDSRPTGWYTLEEAGERIGRTRQAMHMRVKAGTLRAQRIGGRWLVSSEVLDALVAGERANAVSAGTVRMLHPELPAETEDLSARLAAADLRAAELEAQLGEERRTVARQDAYIADLVRHVHRLRDALATLTEAPGPPPA